jgi:hypothetical protein
MASVPIKSRPLQASAFYPGGKNMLKKRFLFVALTLTIWTAVAPAVVSARPIRGERVSQWKTAVSMLMTWWGIFGAPERGTVPARQTDWIKNGCGIDPNGTPLCDPDPSGGTGGGTGIGGSGLEGGSDDGSGDSGY